jgi:mannitol/fructose-specific phosphotransferase system IIA component (Ntr-type)
LKKGKDAELIVSTLQKREELGSTGIGKGIAIPHCRSLAVDKLEIAVGRTTKPISFNAIDKKPVSLIFLIIAPPQDPGNQYLITLGKIVQIAKEMTKKKVIQKPQTQEEFIALIDQIEKDLRKKK